MVYDGACLSLLDSNALKRKVNHVLLINKLVEEERLAIKDGEDPKLRHQRIHAWMEKKKNEQKRREDKKERRRSIRAYSAGERASHVVDMCLRVLVPQHTCILFFDLPRMGGFNDSVCLRQCPVSMSC